MTRAHDVPRTYGQVDEPLTDYERARLRAEVDVAALERYLRASSGTDRRVVIASFAREILPEDIAILDPEWSPIPPAFLTEDGQRFLPSVSFDLQVKPHDPMLQALWQRIEERAAG